MAIGVDPTTVGWAVAFGMAAGFVAWGADRWAANLDDSANAGAGDLRWRVITWAAAGIVYGALVGNRGLDAVAAAFVLAIAALLLTVALIDVRTKLIPLAALAALLLAGIVRGAADGALSASAIGALVGAAVFALLWAAALPLRARAGTTPFGFGDVLLAAGIGAVVGWPSVLPTLFLGAVFGAVGSILLLATRSARATDAIPYGVFLCAAALVAEVAGM